MPNCPESLGSPPPKSRKGRRRPGPLPMALGGLGGREPEGLTQVLPEQPGQHGVPVWDEVGLLFLLVLWRRKLQAQPCGFWKGALWGLHVAARRLRQGHGPVGQLCRPESGTHSAFLGASPTHPQDLDLQLDPGQLLSPATVSSLSCQRDATVSKEAAHGHPRCSPSRDTAAGNAH